MIAIPSARAGDAIAPPQQEAASALVEIPSWTVRLPKDANVVYKGEVSFDSAGKGTGSMLYPAVSAVTMLAAVVTHALLVESSKSRQKDNMQEEADKVLIPYQSVLGDYKHQELMQRGLELTSTPGTKRLIQFSEQVGADWVVDSVPVFWITQDQSAIVLDNSISVHPPSAPSTAVSRYTVRVVSNARGETDLAGYWTAEGGQKLKEQSAGLFAQSLDIALGQSRGATSKSDEVFRTVRYRQGKAEKMERGRLIGAHCDRIVVKTLRGWFMSVPVVRNEADIGADDQCAHAPGS